MATTKICIPVRETTMKATIRSVKKAYRYADIVEVWIDGIKDLDLELLMRNQFKPFLIVNKAAKEKGKWKGTERERIELLCEAAQKGAHFIDIGLHTNPKLIAHFKKSSRKARLILSHHDFTKTPTLKKLNDIIKKAKTLKADIIKIATTTKTSSDAARLLSLFEEKGRTKTRKIILGMGKKGKITRIAGIELGNYLTFVALDQKKKTATGQLTLKDLKSLKNLI